MQIDVQLLPCPLDSHHISHRAVVVIDVLRAASVMVHALSQGAQEIIPVKTVDEAVQMAKTFPPKTTLLGGERGSRRIEGFDLGNSPREYMAERVRGKRLILTTTNGTRAFYSVSSAKEVLVGSFFNIKAVAERCLEMDRDLLIFPSGDEGDFSLEDTVCGGMLVDQIVEKSKTAIHLTDASHSARTLYGRFRDHLVEVLHLSRHGKELIDRGYGDDLPYCAQIDIAEIAPVFREGVIRVPLSPSGRGMG
jgi:2-phosphosulfolactate phosphatase